MTALRERAWENEDEYLATSGEQRLHIPKRGRVAVCGQGPESPFRGRVDAVRGGRDSREWCRACLQAVYGCGASVEPGNPEGFVVSTAKRTHDLAVYHSRECYAYPEEVREASPREVEELEECGACRMTPREGVPE